MMTVSKDSVLWAETFSGAVLQRKWELLLRHWEVLVSAIARMFIDNQITVSNWLLSEVSESAQAVALGISEKPLEVPKTSWGPCHAMPLLCTSGRHCLKAPRYSWLVNLQTSPCGWREFVYIEQRFSVKQATQLVFLLGRISCHARAHCHGGDG